MIHTIEDFVDPTIYLNRQLTFRDIPADNVWHNRVADLQPDLGVPLLRHLHEVINGTSDTTVWADTLNYAVWRKGDQQHAHADGQTNDGEPNEFHWRTVGCVLYLNDGYTGGSIYFPQHDIELTPKPGTLVWFPGTAEFLHGVSPVESGERITIASFWGENPPAKHPFYDLEGIG
jgi:hypothetical protein